MEAHLPLGFPQSKQQVGNKCGVDSSSKSAYVSTNGLSSKADLEHMMRIPSPTIAAGSAAPQYLSSPSCFIRTDEVPNMAGSPQIQASQAPQFQLSLHFLSIRTIHISIKRASTGQPPWPCAMKPPSPSPSPHGTTPTPSPPPPALSGMMRSPTWWTLHRSKQAKLRSWASYTLFFYCCPQPESQQKLWLFLRLCKDSPNAQFLYYVIFLSMAYCLLYTIWIYSFNIYKFKLVITVPVQH